MTNDECTDLFIKHFTFWNNLSQPEKELLCNNVSKVTYTMGSTLHSGSEDCVGFILVKSGQLRVYMLSEEGREITLYRLFKGDTCILSASCVLDAITFDVFINAEEESEVMLIKSSVFNQLTKQNIYVEAYASKLAVMRFSEVMWTMQQILFMSFDKRLAVFLVDELSKSTESTKNDEIKLTHEQIARYIGSAREVVTRMLKYFADEGIVKLSRGTIKIIDKKKLKELI